MSYRFADRLNLAANLYGIHHCCVYSEKLLMMDRGSLRNMYGFIPKNKFEKLVHLVGFIIRNNSRAKFYTISLNYCSY